MAVVRQRTTDNGEFPGSSFICLPLARKCPRMTMGGGILERPTRSDGGGCNSSILSITATFLLAIYLINPQASLNSLTVNCPLAEDFLDESGANIIVPPR